jgi:Tol biopolymer transport system component
MRCLVVLVALMLIEAAGATTPNAPGPSLFAVGLGLSGISPFPLPDEIGSLGGTRAPAVSATRALAFGAGDKVYVLRGQHVRQVAQAPAEAARAQEIDAISWAPNGKSLAFGVAGSTWTVWSVRADGKNLRRLGSGRRPRWSPDGRWVAVETRLDTSANGHAIGVISPTRRTTRTIARVGATATVSGPSWSWEGKALAFTTKVRNAAWVTIAHGPGLRRVKRVARGFDPEWSPVANLLVVARSTGIFVLDSWGSVLRRVGICEQLSLVLCRAPEWSPDGSRIAWLTGKDFFGELRATDRGPTRGHIVVVGRYMTEPLAWSRDGRTIFGVASQVGPPPSM